MHEYNYYVVKTRKGKYRIHVETPKGKRGDAFKIFKGGSMWKDYNTEQEAQAAIDSMPDDAPSINEPTMSPDIVELAENMRRFKTKNLL